MVIKMEYQVRIDILAFGFFILVFWVTITWEMCHYLFFIIINPVLLAHSCLLTHADKTSVS